MMVNSVLEILVLFTIISAIGGVPQDVDKHKQKILSRQKRYLIFPENAALLTRLSLAANLIGVTDPNNWFHIIELDAIYKLPNTTRLSPINKNKRKKTEPESHNNKEVKPTSVYHESETDIHYYEEAKPDDYYYKEPHDIYYHKEEKTDDYYYKNAKQDNYYYKEEKPKTYYEESKQDNYKYKEAKPYNYRYKEAKPDNYYYKEEKPKTYYEGANQNNYYFTHRRDRRDVYNEMKGILESQGLDGDACVLRAICEVKHVLSHATQLSIFEEILQAIFTIPPGSDDLFHNDIRTNENSTTESACDDWISRCNISLLDFVFTNSDVHL